MTEFTRKDIRNLMMVKLRGPLPGTNADALYKIVCGSHFYSMDGTLWNATAGWADDITAHPTEPELDIIEVLGKPKHSCGPGTVSVHYNMLWHRPELTLKQKEIIAIKKHIEELQVRIAELEKTK